MTADAEGEWESPTYAEGEWESPTNADLDGLESSEWDGELPDGLQIAMAAKGKARHANTTHARTHTHTHTHAQIHTGCAPASAWALACVHE